MTAQELSPELGICVSAVRQHTALLERDGMILSRQRKSRVGRPGKEYALTDASEDEFPKAYKKVALQILEAVRQVGGEEMLGQVIASRYAGIKKNIEPELKQLPPQERLRKIAERQETNGYLARFEETDHQQRLIQHNCPAMGVSAQFPQFCECERQMYEELIGHRVDLDASRSQGAHCCTFTVQF
jgi:predicted ArsR family transcriptional regulator